MGRGNRREGKGREEEKGGRGTGGGGKGRVKRRGRRRRGKGVGGGKEVPIFSSSVTYVFQKLFTRILTGSQLYSLGPSL